MDKSVAPVPDDWGDRPGKRGIAIEAKLGMFIIMTLLAAFGLLVYRNVDLHERHLLAGEGSDRKESSELGEPALSSAAKSTVVIDEDRNLSAAQVSFFDAGHETSGAETADHSFDGPSLQEPASPEMAVDDWPQDGDQDSFNPATVKNRFEDVDPFANRLEEPDESFISDSVDEINSDRLSAIADAPVAEQSMLPDNNTTVDDELDQDSPVSDSNDENSRAGATENSFPLLFRNEAKEETTPDTDPEFATAILDAERRGNFDDPIDTAETYPRQLLDTSGPLPGDEEWGSSDPVFASEGVNASLDAGTEEIAVLRPVTGAGELQTPFELTPGTAEFNLPDFAYEHHVITASAESEPCDLCEVQPGDNYWKISRRIYGTTRYFSALALYNHKRIPDPKKLRPGMKVLLPTAKFLEEKYSGLFRSATPREPHPGGYFVRPDGTAAYRIGERDTLSEIAQKHLGRSSRWIQIYRLNRNVLSNPNRLKPGTVISLPDNATDVHMVP